MKKVPKSYDFGTNGVPGRSRTVDVQLRRLTLYPTEVRGLIHDLDKYAVYMRDLGTNDLMLRRQSLYTTELRGHTVKTVIFTRHSITQKGRSVKRISSIGTNPSEIPVKNHRADAGVFLHSPDFFLYLLYHKNGDLSMTFAEI